MEITFTLTIGITLIALLATFMILLKGTRNFVYRTIGLVCFVTLLCSITWGYLSLMGHPKPLHYENWYTAEVEEEPDKGKEIESSDEEPSQDGEDKFRRVLEMDILKWEYDPQRGEAYLWMREEREPGKENQPAMNYSFGTKTEAGAKLLKQLQEATREARRRGMRGRGTTGVKLRIVIDRLWMSDDNRFLFFAPPPKLLLPKADPPPPGTYYPDTTGVNPNARSEPDPRPNNNPSSVYPVPAIPEIESPVMDPGRFQRH